MRVQSMLRSFGRVPSAECRTMKNWLKILGPWVQAAAAVAAVV